MTVSTGKYYTQMTASSFGTFANDRLRLGDCLTQVTASSGSTVPVARNRHELTLKELRDGFAIRYEAVAAYSY